MQRAVVFPLTVNTSTVALQSGGISILFLTDHYLANDLILITGLLPVPGTTDFILILCIVTVLTSGALTESDSLLSRVIHATLPFLA